MEEYPKFYKPSEKGSYLSNVRFIRVDSSRVHKVFLKDCGGIYRKDVKNGGYIRKSSFYKYYGGELSIGIFVEITEAEAALL
jgi:hypothetical protein